MTLFLCLGVLSAGLAYETSACWQNILANWVAVKELNLSYYIGGTLLFTIYTHYCNLSLVPQQQPSKEATACISARTDCWGYV